jgi:ribosomal protein S18 acetylase RimI-like enzyme
MSPEKRITIRKFQSGDRQRVRDLCCDTGFLGNPIDPVFEDRELFADYLTAYYTDWEPESSFVLLVNDEIRGYLLGSRFPFRQQCYAFYQNISLFLRGMFRYRGYNVASKKFVQWIIRTAWREVPAAPRRTAHFHINVLPDARQLSTTRALTGSYLKYLHEHGEKRVYGQMVVFEDRRGAKMFERYGFKVVNKAEISKYRDLHPHPVYLCTVVKDLVANDQLYACAS